MFEGRLSKVVAFTFTVRWVPWVSDTIVRGELTGNPGGNIQLEVELIDLKNAFAFIPGFVFSWRRANIRLGVGYGDIFDSYPRFAHMRPQLLPGFAESGEYNPEYAARARAAVERMSR